MSQNRMKWECSSIFIIVLAARNQEAEKIMASDAGADDYINDQLRTFISSHS